MQENLIGSYKILEEIGRGGMGIVYLGEQVSLKRQVAIKTLPVEMAHDEEYLERIENEAKILAKFSNPNIVYIHDRIIQDDTIYLIMEYVPGITVADRLRDEGPYAMDEAARIIIRVAVALEHAHSKGIIHRDIKPSNIMIRSDNVVKVTDFGIAKSSEGAEITLVRFTPGTREYMSPEQARGLKDTDGKSDIYSLGVVFYVMVTGKLPPYPVPARLPFVPPRYGKIILKCLAEDRTERYQTARDLVIALDEAKEDSKRHRKSRPADRPFKKKLLLIGMLVVVLLSALSIWQFDNIERFLKPPSDTTPQPLSDTTPQPPSDTTPQPPSDTTPQPPSDTTPQPPSEKPVQQPSDTTTIDEIEEIETTWQDPKAEEFIHEAPEAPDSFLTGKVTEDSIESLQPVQPVQPSLSPLQLVNRQFRLKTRFDANITDENEAIAGIHDFLANDQLVQVTHNTDYELYFAIDQNDRSTQVRYTSRIHNEGLDSGSQAKLTFENIRAMILTMHAIIKREYCFKILRSLQALPENQGRYRLEMAIQGGQADRLRVGQKIDICLKASNVSQAILFGVDLEGIYLIPPQPGKITTEVEAAGSTCFRNIEVAAATGTEMVFAIGAPDEMFLSKLLAMENDTAMPSEWSFTDPDKPDAVDFCERLYLNLKQTTSPEWAAGTQFIITRR